MNWENAWRAYQGISHDTVPAEVVSLSLFAMSTCRLLGGYAQLPLTVVCGAIARRFTVDKPLHCTRVVHSASTHARNGRGCANTHRAYYAVEYICHSADLGLPSPRRSSTFTCLAACAGHLLLIKQLEHWAQLPNREDWAHSCTRPCIHAHEISPTSHWMLRDPDSSHRVWHSQYCVARNATRLFKINTITGWLIHDSVAWRSSPDPELQAVGPPHIWSATPAYLSLAGCSGAHRPGCPSCTRCMAGHHAEEWQHADTQPDRG